MDDLPIDKIQISGAALASLLHRSSASSGDTHGYLFGHAAVSTHNPLSDHHHTAAAPLLITTITSFLSLPSHLPLPPPPPSTTLLGWFSARRKTPLRPSLKDAATTLSLSTQNPLFLLVTTPFQDQLIHTLEYKAFQYKANKFEPKSLTIINIGPSFRSQYESFSPNVPFPMMDFEMRGSNDMVEDKDGESIGEKSRRLKDQKQLDNCAVGFEIGKLSRLMGSEGSYTAEIEDLYEKMLNKIDNLARLVEATNDEVQKQEEKNMKLRYKVAGLD